MTTHDEMPRPLMKKPGGLILVLLGFLLAAAGYRSGNGWYIGAGVVSLALGLFLMIRKIMARNRSGQQ